MLHDSSIDTRCDDEPRGHGKPELGHGGKACAFTAKDLFCQCACLREGEDTLATPCRGHPVCLSPLLAELSNAVALVVLGEETLISKTLN